MVVDLRWRDAMAAPVIACEFNARGDGWPVAMTAIQLAVMQRPYVRGDTAARNLVWALRGHIEAGRKDGSIAHTEKVERVLSRGAVIQNRQPDPGGWPAWYERDGYDSGRSRPAIYKDVTRFYIDAPAFAAWLHATHLEPSPHIAAWFDVRGVAWPVASTSNTGDTRAATVAAPQAGMQWTGALLAARRADLEAAGVKAPMQALTAECGIKERDIRRLIAADKSSKSKAAPSGPTSVFNLASKKRSAGR